MELKQKSLPIHILPPRGLLCTTAFGGVPLSDTEYHRVLDGIQRLRGKIYAADGAIATSSLDQSGRHRLTWDEENWHLYMVDPATSDPTACFRLKLHPNTVNVEQLYLYTVIARLERDKHDQCHVAITTLIGSARTQGICVGEVGGWAVDEHLRNSTSTFPLPFAAWSLYQIIGDSIVFATATTRHRSASILKRIGGFPVIYGGQPITFVDQYFNCGIELIGFDSRRPYLRFATLVDAIKRDMASKLTVAA